MRDELMKAFRRAVEAALPWYDPQREVVKDRRTERHAREAERLAEAVENTARALRHGR